MLMDKNMQFLHAHGHNPGHFLPPEFASGSQSLMDKLSNTAEFTLPFQQNQVQHVVKEEKGPEKTVGDFLASAFPLVVAVIGCYQTSSGWLRGDDYYIGLTFYTITGLSVAEIVLMITVFGIIPIISDQLLKFKRQAMGKNVKKHSHFYFVTFLFYFVL